MLSWMFGGGIGGVPVAPSGLCRSSISCCVIEQADKCAPLAGAFIPLISSSIPSSRQDPCEEDV